MDIDRNGIVYYNYLSSILKKITFYFCVIIVPLAICWNLFGILVLFSKRKSSTKNNTSLMIYLLKWQYVIDTIFLNNIFFNIKSYYIFGYEIQNMTYLSCPLTNLITRFILHISSWMQVIICLDRFIITYLGPKFNFRMNQTRTIILISAIMAIIVWANTANLFRNLSANTYRLNSTKNVTLMSCDAKNL